MSGCRPWPLGFLDLKSEVIKLAYRPPLGGIGDPAVDFGFMPASPVVADLELSREGAFGDLAIDGGAGQASPGEDGFQADKLGVQAARLKAIKIILGQ